MEEILDRLISIVQDTAPAVWTIARRQVMSNIAETVIWAMFLLACAVLLAWSAKHCREKYETTNDDDWQLGRGFSAACAAIMLFIVIGLTVGTVKYLINPEYYAIKVLLDLIG